MSFVIVIISVIVLLLFLLVFTLGFFMGLGRKKKELKFLEKEQEIQKKTQESIISYLSKTGKESKEEDDATIMNPISIISKEYKRLRRYLKVKNLVKNIKEIDAIKYVRQYFLTYIGIAVLTFGFGYFLKFSLTASNIDVYGRFAISVLTNLVLIFLSHVLRKKYKTFSSILMGGALGSLFITFTVSFYIYHIFSNLQIFGIYFILTGFSVVLSWFYNKFELVLLALIAGFTAPLFSNFDFKHVVSLLVYIILLDIGAIIISSKFKSFLIRLIPALYSGLYLLLWLKFCIVNNVYNEIELSFLLVTLLYFVLIILSVIYNIKIKTNNYMPYELMMVLIINLIYYTAGMYMLNVLNPDYKGLFTAAIAFFNITFLIILLLICRNYGEKLVFFFSIISLLFLTLIPPVELVGKSITMIWAVETVLLMWVSIKLDIKMLKLASSFLMIGLIASFLLDFFENYMIISSNSSGKDLMINKSFVSGLMTSFGLGLNVLIINKSQDRYLIKPIKMRHLKIFISIFAVIALYISIYTEILYQLTKVGKDSSLIQMYLGIYNYAFILLFFIAFLFIKAKKIKILSGILALLSVALFFLYYLYNIIEIRDTQLLNLTITLGEFNYHIALVSLILIIVFLAYINFSRINPIYKRIALWGSCFLIIAVLMTEIDHFAVIFNSHSGLPLSTIITDVHRYYYSLFMAITAFIISISALVFKDKEHGRLSIFIIMVTLLKLFVFDLQGLQNTQRIVSYITIGCIALFIAFVRQRIFEKTENNSQIINNN